MVYEREYQVYIKTYQTEKDGLRNAKKSLSLSDAIPGVHPVLSELYAYACSMGFDDEPHYDEMQRKLKEMLGSTGFANEGKILRDQDTDVCSLTFPMTMIDYSTNGSPRFLYAACLYTLIESNE
jgi:hypothetical protein